jgi:hypothetical protein
VFPPPGAGQVFRPLAGGPDKSSGAVLSKERRKRHGPSRWTTDGEEAHHAGGRAIEKYVAELNRVSYEHEVVFSRLHERRVEVIAGLYTKLVDAEVAFGSWVRPLQLAGESPMDEKAKTAMQAGNEFQDAFLRSRIWLDEDLCKRLEALNKAIYEVFVDFTTYKADDPQTAIAHREAWKRSWDRMNEDVAGIRREIESGFRDMLGVKPAN